MFTVKRYTTWLQHQPHPPGVDPVSWLAAWRGQGETSRPPRSCQCILQCLHKIRIT